VTERQDSARRRDSRGDSSDLMSSDAEMDPYERHQTFTSTEHTNAALEQHLRDQAPQSSSTANTQDADMDDLTRTMAGTSLDFVPRGVRRKQKEKQKIARSSSAQ
jgi:hypothetical protein